MTVGARKMFAASGRYIRLATLMMSHNSHPANIMAAWLENLLAKAIIVRPPAMVEKMRAVL